MRSLSAAVVFCNYYALTFRLLWGNLIVPARHRSSPSGGHRKGGEVHQKDERGGHHVQTGECVLHTGLLGLRLCIQPCVPNVHDRICFYSLRKSYFVEFEEVDCDIL